MQLPNITKFDYDVNFDAPFKQQLESIRQNILNFIETVSSSTENVDISAVSENDIELMLLDHYSNRIARYLVSSFIKNNRRGVSDPDKFIWPYEVIEVDPETKEKIKEEIGPKQKEINGHLVDTDRLFDIWSKSNNERNPDNPTTETQAAKRESATWIKNMIDKMQSTRKAIDSAFAIFDSRFIYKENNAPQEIADLKSIFGEIDNIIKSRLAFFVNRLTELNNEANKYATGFTREEYVDFSKDVEQLISRLKEFLSRIVNGINAIIARQTDTTKRGVATTDSGRIKEFLNNGIMDLNTMYRSIQTQMVKNTISAGKKEEDVGNDIGYVDIPKSVLNDIKNAVDKKIFRSPLVYATEEDKSESDTNQKNLKNQEKLAKMLEKVEDKIKEYIKDTEQKLKIKNAKINSDIETLNIEYKTGIKNIKGKSDFLSDKEMLDYLGRIRFLATKKIDINLQRLRMISVGKLDAEQIEAELSRMQEQNAKIDEEIQKAENDYSQRVQELQKKKITVPQKLENLRKRIVDLTKLYNENHPLIKDSKKVIDYFSVKENSGFRSAELVKKIVNLNSKTLHLKKDVAEELLNFCVMNGVHFTTIDPSLIKYARVGEEETAIDKTDRIVLTGATINGHLSDMYTDTKKNIERFVNYKIDDMIENMDYI